MIRALLMFAALATAASLQGCANLSPDAMAMADDGIDHVKMDGVERRARSRGVDVIWVNPPRKPS